MQVQHTSVLFWHQIPIQLRCRKRSSASFVFTFVSQDGSIQVLGDNALVAKLTAIQRAAAIPPRNPCPNYRCGVLLSFHDSVTQSAGIRDLILNHAELYRTTEAEYGIDELWVLVPTRTGSHNWEGGGDSMSIFLTLRSFSRPWSRDCPFCATCFATSKQRITLLRKPKMWLFGKHPTSNCCWPWNGRPRSLVVCNAYTGYHYRCPPNW